jgi:hypothetical protein
MYFIYLMQHIGLDGVVYYHNNIVDATPSVNLLFELAIVLKVGPSYSPDWYQLVPTIIVMQVVDGECVKLVPKLALLFRLMIVLVGVLAFVLVIIGGDYLVVAILILGN